MKYYTSWGKSLEHVILNEKKDGNPAVDIDRR